MTPSLLESRERRYLLLRLLAVGIAQSALALSLALLVSEALETGPRAKDTAAMLAATILFVALRAWQRREAEALGYSYVHDIRVAIFAHTCRLPMGQRGPKIGPTLTRMTNDLLAVKNWISYGVASLAVAATTVSGALAALTYLDWRLAAASAVGMGATLLVSLAAVPALSRHVVEARQLRGKLAANLGDKLVARHAIESLGRSDVETRKIAKQSRALSRMLVQRGLMSGIVRFAPEAAIALAVAALPLFLALAPVRPGGGETGPAVVAWLFVMGLAVSQLLDAARAFDYLTNFKPAMRRIRAILALPTLQRPSSIVPIPVHSNASETPALEIDGPALARMFPGVSAPSRLDQGQIGRITGGPAASRSALCLYLSRMAQQEQDCAQLGGAPLTMIPAETAREWFVLVSPELALFSGTVGGNIRKGARRELDTTRLVEINQICRLANDTAALDALLDVETGEGRPPIDPELAARARLARALARETKFLILDDDRLAADEQLLERLARHAALRGIGILISCEGTTGHMTRLRAVGTN